jgi:CubicO group peptidase (beta-lactamase class C family)
MKLSIFICALLIIGMVSCSSDSSAIEDEPTLENTYFPPMNSSTWETISMSELGWNESQLQPLLDYLEEKHSKGFIILHDGKIVVECYMNGHAEGTNWYWASAGKTLTSTVSGIAQDEGLININNKVSDYIGTGWTRAPIDKENLIICKNLLSMNSGLDDTSGGGIEPENLSYVANAGTRWAYHNVYVKMQDVVAQASNQTWDNYFNGKLRNKIGMNGVWFPFENSNVYASNTRSMARFGLMIYAKGKWENTQIVSEAYLNEATNTSQNINKSYGYLWWLNGKSSYHLPQTQLEFNGSLIPNAPADMLAALGKNDQKIYIVPSMKLVIVRMGDAADELNFGLSDFDNTLWQKINALTN